MSGHTDVEAAYEYCLELFFGGRTEVTKFRKNKDSFLLPQDYYNTFDSKSPH